MKKIITRSIMFVLAILSLDNAYATFVEADTALATKLVETAKVNADSVIATNLKATNLEMKTITAETVNATSNVNSDIITAKTIQASNKSSARIVQAHEYLILRPSSTTDADASDPIFLMNYGSSDMSNKFSIHFDNDTVASDIGIQLSTSSYTGHHHMNFAAYEYNFLFYDKSGKKSTRTMNVDGRIVCKEEIRVAEVNTDKVNAKDINVELGNAADYVFDEGYDLKSLGEVEEYVKSNKHLPGVPSASEFQEKGMNVSEMSNLLLEKVEELTLHLIRLQKEVDQLREENNALKNRE
ncbi:MAG: hypothetical protein IKN77_08145 [Paludibacteraceae bacterium]|nr:hypothetical protein [Paludibacteraceae bacterium]